MTDVRGCAVRRRPSFFSGMMGSPAISREETRGGLRAQAVAAGWSKATSAPPATAGLAGTWQVGGPGARGRPSPG